MYFDVPGEFRKTGRLSINLKKNYRAAPSNQEMEKSRTISEPRKFAYSLRWRIGIKTIIYGN